MMAKMGEGMMNRLNLGGAGAGLNRGGAGNELSQSTNMPLGAGGEMQSYRSQMGGVDKSMDNFKLGFGN